jgi:Chitobiase/beta-hexosaminidase C-terminal domain/FG-GAP-like repeat
MRSLLYRQRGLVARALPCLVLLALMDGCGSGSSGENSTSAPNPTAATPTFTPANGTSFSSTLSLSIADATPAATIYYTTDGSAPTTSSSVYSGPITIKATTTVNAIATATGFAQSAAGSAIYTLASPPSPAATPAFTPAGGTTFSSTLSVSIADATPGATIYYTTNGSAPTTSSSVYSGPITISASTTIEAIATASGFAQSAVASAAYTLQSPAATPSFTPASGTSFSNSLSVSIADSTPGATIHYTTNGSTPTTTSSVYSSPIAITGTTTIQAIATASGFTQSAVASASYTDLGNATGGIVSDNFDEPALNTALWTTENPLGDGIVTMNGTAATLNVPQGTVHDLSTTADNALRIMQPIANTNFSVDVRFQSAPEIGNQDEGILVEQDTGDFLRFDVLYNGTTGPELFAEGITGTTATPFISTQISLPKAPLVLRLARNGNVWTGSWSADGTTFTAAPNFTFDLNVAKIGPYAGTYAPTATSSPSFTAIADYFFVTSGPVANQNGPLPYGYATVDANPPGTTVEKTLADIQGTGQLEPVIGLEQYDVNGSNSNGGIYWYSYPTSGGVQGTWTIHTIINDGNAYEDMVPLDVNGDGAVDIIASYNNTSGNYQVVWFENPRGSGGDPTQPWVQHVIGPGLGENNLEIADIDGDGKPDLVTASSVFFQNSPDSWTQVQYSTSFRGIALLDIGSGHGAINLAGTGPSPFNAVWYENPRETGGNARTGTWIMHTIGATPYPCGANNCADGGDIATLGTMDVNGDGLIDIVSGQSEGLPGLPPPPGGLIWWQAPADRRNGTWIKHTIDVNVVDTHEIAIADMNKDGNLDIVVSEQDQSPLRRVMVYYDDGKGNLTPEVLSNAEGHNIVVGNVTNNPAGELDILNCGHGYYLDAHPLQIFLNPY